MRLKHITFTGIDERTDIDRLREIQQAYPIAEFGVLTSYKWFENGNRYPSMWIKDKLKDNNLHLSLHLCGKAAHDAAIGRWYEINKLVHGSLGMFNRVQLNISSRKDNPERVAHKMFPNQELIIQQRNSKEIDVFINTLKRYGFLDRYGYSMLLDASGGRGIDTPIEILKTNVKVGYAGGFNPDNVADKLDYLFENVPGDFWIDMESGVRTDDWFDLDKVTRVLEICQPIINKHCWDQLPENKSLFNKSQEK